jgi:hypothetical protein
VFGGVRAGGKARPVAGCALGRLRDCGGGGAWPLPAPQPHHGCCTLQRGHSTSRCTTLHHAAPRGANPPSLPPPPSSPPAWTFSSRTPREALTATGSRG